MSGGAFGYEQYKIGYIADEIQQRLERQGQTIPKEERWSQYDPTEYETYPLEVQQILKDGLSILRKAAIYAQRIDWYFSSDDSEESMIRRLKEELDQLEKTNQL